MSLIPPSRWVCVCVCVFPSRREQRDLLRSRGCSPNRPWRGLDMGVGAQPHPPRWLWGQAKVAVWGWGPSSRRPAGPPRRVGRRCLFLVPWAQNKQGNSPSCWAWWKLGLHQPLGWARPQSCCRVWATSPLGQGMAHVCLHRMCVQRCTRWRLLAWPLRGFALSSSKWALIQQGSRHSSNDGPAAPLVHSAQTLLDATSPMARSLALPLPQGPALPVLPRGPVPAAPSLGSSIGICHSECGDLPLAGVRGAPWRGGRGVDAESPNLLGRALSPPGPQCWSLGHSSLPLLVLDSACVAPHPALRKPGSQDASSRPRAQAGHLSPEPRLWFCPANPLNGIDAVSSLPWALGSLESFPGPGPPAPSLCSARVLPSSWP